MTQKLTVFEGPRIIIADSKQNCPYTLTVHEAVTDNVVAFHKCSLPKNHVGPHLSHTGQPWGNAERRKEKLGL